MSRQDVRRRLNAFDARSHAIEVATSRPWRSTLC